MGLKRVYSLPHLARAAELLRNLHNRPVIRNRWHLQHVWHRELRCAFLRVLVEQLLQDSPRDRAVLVEELGTVAAERLGSLTPRASVPRGAAGPAFEYRLRGWA